MYLTKDTNIAKSQAHNKDGREEDMKNDTSNTDKVQRRGRTGWANKVIMYQQRSVWSIMTGSPGPLSRICNTIDSRGVIDRHIVPYE